MQVLPFTTGKTCQRGIWILTARPYARRRRSFRMVLKPNNHAVATSTTPFIPRDIDVAIRLHRDAVSQWVSSTRSKPSQLVTRWAVRYQQNLVEAFYKKGIIIREKNVSSHHGIPTGRQLKEIWHHRSWIYLYLMRVRAHTSQASDVPYVSIVVDFEFSILPWGGRRASEKYRVNLYRQTPRYRDALYCSWSGGRGERAHCLKDAICFYQPSGVHTCCLVCNSLHVSQILCIYGFILVDGENQSIFPGLNLQVPTRAQIEVTTLFGDCFAGCGKPPSGKLPIAKLAKRLLPVCKRTRSVW